MPCHRLRRFFAAAAGERVLEGPYTETVDTPDGRRIVFRVTFATGVGSQAWGAAYRDRFGGAPRWLSWLHPWHRRRLC